VGTQFVVLGGVSAYLDGRPVALGHARQRCVLAALLVDANRPVPVDQLADRVWGDEPPQRAYETLYSYLSRLRNALAGTGVGLVRQPAGYVLTADAASVDLHRFRALVRQARTSQDDEHTRALLDEALGLWRGEAFATLDTPWLNRLRETLDRERLAAELDRADVRLRGGDHAALVAELSSAVAAYPLDERLAGQLMLAQYRCGRTGEALREYQRARTWLAEELGIDPGPALRALHRQILAADPALDLPSGPGVVALSPAGGFAGAGSGAVPRQLPAPPAYFVGRTRELAELTRAAGQTGDPDGTVVISAIGGTGGIGKTWLALRWAHDNRQRFPDGQLYVNLRGFDACGWLDPAEAVRGFLDALGVPVDRVPDSLDAQAALYRSLLAGKRVLVLLDNARDVEQVRPLLPGSPGCLVVVTSRNQLASLVAADGARPLTLDLLTAGEARDLLARRLGTGRVEAEPEAVSEIVERCARLPLALAVAAARAANRADFPLAALAAELRESAGGLDAFTGDDPATDVRIVLSWSYHRLSPPAATLFRRLGLHPGPDFGIAAVASLAGVPVRQVRPPLNELVRAHLLAELRPGRYAFHDLLRAYAAELAHGGGGEEAAHRLLDHYLHTAWRAALLLDPHQSRIDPHLPLPGVTPEYLADSGAALDWFCTEHPVLLAAVELAGRAGFGRHAWQLAAALSTFLDRQGHWTDQLAVQQTALGAAQRSGDATGQAYALRSLGLAAARLGQLTDTYAYTREALRLSERDGDRNAQARALLTLAWVHERQGQHADALDRSQRALELYRLTGHLAGQARALNSLGWNHAQLGDHETALARCREALPLHAATDDRGGEANTWSSIGDIHSASGELGQAVTCYEHALDEYRRLGDRYNEAASLATLGDTHHAAGALDPAELAWRDAVAILDRLAHPDAERVRARLRGGRPARL
jgi:DNA-binding SARP family transcriptional activator